MGDIRSLGQDVHHALTLDPSTLPSAFSTLLAYASTGFAYRCQALPCINHALKVNAHKFSSKVSHTCPGED